MIYVTGDCHRDFCKLSAAAFPEQKDMTKEDIVMICGDFGGIWDTDRDSSFEQYWLKWINDKPFTTVFVDGNHENFHRLNTEFETVPFYGGQAHQLRSSIFHLLRGEVYTIQGKTFFTFGGAACHDNPDGVIDRDAFDSDTSYKNALHLLRKQGKEFRIKGVNWWPEELPSDDEIQHAEETLAKHNYTVDFVLSHCAPQSIVPQASSEDIPPDKLTLYFDDLAQRLHFGHWFFGHYHGDKKITPQFILLYHQLVRIR